MIQASQPHVSVRYEMMLCMEICSIVTRPNIQARINNPEKCKRLNVEVYCLPVAQLEHDMCCIHVLHKNYMCLNRCYVEKFDLTCHKEQRNSESILTKREYK